MTHVIGFFGILCAASVFGALVFFSAVVTPRIFSALETDVAGPFLRKLFPWVYFYLIAVSSLGGLALSVARLSPPAVLLMFLIAVLSVKARYLVMPRVNMYRDRMLAGDETAISGFNLMHRLSVMVAVVQLFLSGAALYLLASPA